MYMYNHEDKKICSGSLREVFDGVHLIMRDT